MTPMRPTLRRAASPAGPAGLVGLVAAVRAAAARQLPVTVSSARGHAGNLTVSASSPSGVGRGPPTTSTLKVTVGGTGLPGRRDAAVGSPGEPRPTILVVDTSGSMGDAGMATVRSAVGSFLKSVPDDVAVGVVSFAGTAGSTSRPTPDQGKVQTAVNGLVRRRDRAVRRRHPRGRQSLGSQGRAQHPPAQRRRRHREHGHPGRGDGRPEECQGPRRGRRVQDHRQQQSACSRASPQAGGGSVVSAAQRAAVCRAPSPRPPRRSTRRSASRSAPARASAAPRTSRSAGTSSGKPFARDRARRLRGAGVAARGHGDRRTTSPVVGPTERPSSRRHPACGPAGPRGLPMLGIAIAALSSSALMVLVIAFWRARLQVRAPHAGSRTSSRYVGRRAPPPIGKAKSARPTRVSREPRVHSATG